MGGHAAASSARFFRDLTGKQLRRGIFRNVKKLLESIGEYIDNHNRLPKPFIWTAKASDILEKVKRAQAALGLIVILLDALH